MRIAFVTQLYFPHHIGGLEYAIKRLCTELTKNGHECYVITTSEKPTTTYEIQDKITIIRVRSIVLPLRKDIRGAILAKNLIKNILANIEPDIIHLENPLLICELALVASRELNIPVVVTSHVMSENLIAALNIPKSLHRLADMISYREIIHFYNKCDFLTAPTNKALEIIIEKGLEIPSKVISNGIDITNRKINVNNSDIKQILKSDYNNFSNKKKVILSLGRIDKEKNIDIIIKGFSKMKHKDKAILLIAGKSTTDNGSYIKSLKKLIKDLNLTNKVIFTGYITDDQVKKLYKLTYMYVIASNAELQSLSTLEAMDMGTPVIAADSVALKELIQHNFNGLLFKPNDTDDLANKMDELIENAKLKEDLSLNAINTASSHSIKNTSQEYLSVYTEVIKGNIQNPKPIKKGYFKKILESFYSI